MKANILRAACRGSERRSWLKGVSKRRPRVEDQSGWKIRARISRNTERCPCRSKSRKRGAHIQAALRVEATYTVARRAVALRQNPLSSISESSPHESIECNSD